MDPQTKQLIKQKIKKCLPHIFSSQPEKVNVFLNEFRAFEDELFMEGAEMYCENENENELCCYVQSYWDLRVRKDNIAQPSVKQEPNEIITLVEEAPKQEEINRIEQENRLRVEKLEAYLEEHFSDPLTRAKFVQDKPRSVRFLEGGELKKYFQTKYFEDFHDWSVPQLKLVIWERYFGYELKKTSTSQKAKRKPSETPTKNKKQPRLETPRRSNRNQKDHEERSN